jgi:hypothetical protein
LLRFVHKIIKKSAESRFFALQTAFVPKVRRTSGTRSPVIGIFALLVAQKSTSATGC